MLRLAIDLRPKNHQTDGFPRSSLLSQRIPVLVGVGQHVVRKADPASPPSPLGLAVEACKAALTDCGGATVANSVAKAIDTVAFVRLNSDSISGRSGPFGVYGNLPRLVSAQIGADPATAILSVVGGQSPQQLVSEMCNKIAAGDSDVALLTGSEAIRAMKAALRAGETLRWNDSIEGQLEDRGMGPQLIAPDEIAGGMGFPPQVYGAFEHAWRGKHGMTQAQHMAHMARLFAPFSKVASEHPYAQFPVVRSEEFLSTPGKENYPVADPYLKWHVAQDAVNQGAALLLTHEDRARELGIPQEQWVYLHGAADVQDKLVSRRPALHASAAMASATGAALQASASTIGDIDHLELYSCFPCAVQYACDALGINSENRQLTQTGGLPFFGGAGNNYSMHGIASMVETLRADPGSRGLVLANGGFLSKEAVGIYSTARPDGFTPVDSTAAQRAVDEVADVEQASAPTRGNIEAYSVLYDRGAPLFAYAFMREGDKRFLARTNTKDTAAVERLMAGDPLGEEFGVEVGPKRVTLAV